MDTACLEHCLTEEERVAARLEREHLGEEAVVA